jgi:hypothetical protein
MDTISLGDFRISHDGFYTFINETTLNAYNFIMEDYDQENWIYSDYDAYNACKDDFGDNELDKIDFQAIANAINFNNKDLYHGRI